ncbi:hypothetical protein ACFX2C_031470 [Malus domestica]
MNSNGLASPFMEVDFEGLVATLGGLVGSAQVANMIPSFATAGSTAAVQWRQCKVVRMQWRSNGCVMAVANVKRRRASITAVKRLAGHEASTAASPSSSSFPTNSSSRHPNLYRKNIYIYI